MKWVKVCASGLYMRETVTCSTSFSTLFLPWSLPHSDFLPHSLFYSRSFDIFLDLFLSQSGRDITVRERESLESIHPVKSVKHFIQSFSPVKRKIFSFSFLPTIIRYFDFYPKRKEEKKEPRIKKRKKKEQGKNSDSQDLLTPCFIQKRRRGIVERRL